jgi:thiol-disulfide isomerase/thioredoxin
MIEVSDKLSFENQLRKRKRVLALFYASWCPYCRSLIRAFNEVAPKSGFDLALRVKIDDYANPLWEEYSIAAVPTVLFFDGEKVSRRLDCKLGAGLSEKQLKEWLERT